MQVSVVKKIFKKSFHCLCLFKSTNSNCDQTLPWDQDLNKLKYFCSMYSYAKIRLPTTVKLRLLN